ncbi:hypothetical protein [Methyloglobulus sp.]|uniref:hypothetical protein n=1 Tax=Methyloglobulus sp. TaxID=2518622 RepID=UPI0032B74745
MKDPVEAYISAHSKSQFAGFLLAFLLSPLGLFYSSWKTAILLCIIALASATTIVGPIICWVLAVLINFGAVSSHNEKVRTTANLVKSQSGLKL